METWFSDLSSTHAQLVNQNDYTEKSHSPVQDSGRGAAGLIDASLAGRGSCSRGRPLALGYRVASPLLSGTGSRAAGDWSPVRCHWDPCGVEGTAENNRWGCNQGYNIRHLTLQKSGLCIMLHFINKQHNAILQLCQHLETYVFLWQQSFSQLPSVKKCKAKRLGREAIQRDNPLTYHPTHRSNVFKFFGDKCKRRLKWKKKDNSFACCNVFSHGCISVNVTILPS